jgi:hypothetical protein
LEAAGGGRGSATTQASDGPPEAANEVRRIIAGIATRAHALCQSNVWSRRRFADCRRFNASARAIDGICEILSQVTPGHANAANVTRDPAFPQKAREMLQTLSDHVDLQNPLATLEPDGYRLRRARARRLYDYLNSGDNRDAVRRFLDRPEDEVSERWKRAVMRCLARAVTVALHELEMSPMQEQAAVFAYRSLQADQTLASPIKDTLGIVDNGGQFVVELVGAYTRRAIVQYANDAGRCGRDAERMLRSFTRSYGFTAEEHAAIREDLRSGDATRLRGAQQRVGSRVGSGLTTAFAVLGLVQGLIALSQPLPDDASPDDWMQRGGSILTTGNHAFHLIGAAGELILVDRVGFQRAMTALRGFAEEAGTALSVMGGVLTVFHGVFELQAGIRRGDGLTISIGIGHIVTGGLMIAAVMFEVPGLQPVAIAFALGTAVLEIARSQRDANVPFNRQVFDKLVEELEGQSSFVDRAGMRGQLDQLKTLANRWGDWDMSTSMATNPAISSGGRQGDRDVASYNRRRLRALGLDSLVDRMYPMPA